MHDLPWRGGWGLDAMGAPRLAGIGYPYVVKQLNDLADGKRVPSGAGAVMPVFARGSPNRSGATSPGS